MTSVACGIPGHERHAGAASARQRARGNRPAPRTLAEICADSTLCASLGGCAVTWRTLIFRERGVDSPDAGLRGSARAMTRGPIRTARELSLTEVVASDKRRPPTLVGPAGSNARTAHAALHAYPEMTPSHSRAWSLCSRWQRFLPATGRLSILRRSRRIFCRRHTPLVGRKRGSLGGLDSTRAIPTY
jgi:hypothetical protein